MRVACRIDLLIDPLSSSASAARQVPAALITSSLQFECSRRFALVGLHCETHGSDLRCILPMDETKSGSTRPV